MFSTQCWALLQATLASVTENSQFYRLGRSRPWKAWWLVRAASCFAMTLFLLCPYMEGGTLGIMVNTVVLLISYKLGILTDTF